MVICSANHSVLCYNDHYLLRQKNKEQIAYVIFKYYEYIHYACLKREQLYFLLNKVIEYTP